MTTITIEREVLDEIVELFDSAITARFPHEILRDLRAALAAPATAPDEIERLRKDAERNPMHEGEIQAAWLGHGIEEPMPYTFELGIRSAERFNGIKETP
jgi:hypothetical protein